jgi:mRNA-degrading endonuclease toxin of MazEF toxin-antitoxin module
VLYQAGDILLADLDPVTGHEQGGRRPVLVLSGPSYNESGLRAPSWVQCESVRAISAQRVARQLGRARLQTVADVRNQVISFLHDW